MYDGSVVVEEKGHGVGHGHEGGNQTYGKMN